MLWSNTVLWLDDNAHDQYANKLATTVYSPRTLNKEETAHTSVGAQRLIPLPMPQRCVPCVHTPTPST